MSNVTGVVNKIIILIDKIMVKINLRLI